MSFARRVDGNQAEIVKAVRDAGAFVFDTHTLGKGYPDITVFYKGSVYLVEVKREGESLTDDEIKFHNHAEAHGYTIPIWHSPAEALAFLTNSLISS